MGRPGVRPVRASEIEPRPPPFLQRAQLGPAARSPSLSKGWPGTRQVRCAGWQRGGAARGALVRLQGESRELGMSDPGSGIQGKREVLR